MTSYRNLHPRSPPCWGKIYTSPQKYISTSLNTSCKTLNTLHIDQQDQFEPALLYNEQELVHYQRRNRLRKRGTPKVMIMYDHKGRPKILVQKLHYNLFDVLRNQGWTQKIQAITDVFQIVCDLAREYGFFYVQSNMIKATGKKKPVIWINQHFSANHRQFAIRDSDVAEIIFIKKLKMTFSSFTAFPLSPAVKTIKQMRKYLNEILSTGTKQNMNKKKFVPHPQNDLLSFGFKQQNKETSFRRINTENNDLSIDFKRKFQLVKSKSPSKFKKLPNFSPIYRSPQKVCFHYHNNTINKDKEMLQKSPSIPSFLNLKKKKSIKNRKCSADVNTLSEWLKASNKKIETPFANSTFSTNITLTYLQEMDEKKENRPCNNDGNLDNPQSRNKIHFDLKKMYEKKTIKIEEEPLESQVDNLFDSTNSIKKDNIRESEIHRQLDRLFEKDEPSLEMDGQIQTDFEALMNN